MEVEDAAATTAGEPQLLTEDTEESLDSLSEKNCAKQAVAAARRPGRRSLKTIKLITEEEVDEEEEGELPYTEESPQKNLKLDDSDNESSTAENAHFKLLVSDEDEEGIQEFSEDSLIGDQKYVDCRSSKSRWDVTKKSPRRQFLATLPLNSIKRKRYALQRSGSDEYLLGFDEQSGEPHLVLKDPAEELLDEISIPPESPKAMSPPQKKKKMNTPELTISHQNSPRLSMSPATTPPPPLLLSRKASIENLKRISTETEMASKVQLDEPLDEPLEECLEPLESLEEAREDPLEELKQHVVADSEAEVSSQASVKSCADPANPLNTVATSAHLNVHKKPISAQDDYYKKPFEYGWKRELVYRANMETSKDKADVYFITPGGKKLRTRSDIAPLLEGALTLDHFSFAREPLGVGPELETVRSAKPSHRVSNVVATLAASAPAPAHPGKRISKPKGPKGASPPPQGWTPTRALKTNNAALLSSAGSSKYGGSNPSTPPSSRTSSGTNKSNKTKKPFQSSNAENAENATPSMSRPIHEPCTMMCAEARGQIPQLQCVKCLCLYHHECVGLSRQNCGYRTVGDTSTTPGKDYVCESCLPQAIKPSTTATGAAATASIIIVTTKAVSATPLSSPSVAQAPASALTSAPAPAPALPAVMAPIRKGTPNRHPPPVVDVMPGQRLNKLPQSIAVVKGKKYVMVTKPCAPKAPARSTTNAAISAEHLNDIENDLKQINESIRKSRKQSSASLDASFQPNSIASEVPQRSFATNFFANVSFAYDALLCILKYLKIHERPRAASVCKLWHLAAKDTSLWQTVRMKNSKISNWAGFAGALRRGETKHLDLRKMLFSNAKGEEMWADFSKYIGTVYSLESIDLCRCSAKVVESLFSSNEQLRVLNAVAINDESYNLENIDKLNKLEELRLRTCEPGTLDGDLLSLKALTNLKHLSLTSLIGLGTKTVEVLGELISLRSLELGECGDFDSSFAQVVLPKLSNLQRLRLENGAKTSCCTLEILDTVAKLKHLQQLEFVNFDIKPGFDEKLMLCTNIRKLLIIPTYISQSATTNQIVLYAVQQIADTLKVFTWGVTVELLRVTALYVDQCEESTKKEKHHFDECIPVMKPVPGAPSSSDSQEEEVQDVGPNAVPQIEILPLDKVESILGDNLTTTKFTIVKVPYQSTCKQHLVE